MNDCMKTCSPKGGVRLGGTFIVDHIKKNGQFAGRYEAKNLVVDQGLNHILDHVFCGSTVHYGTWYIGLISTGPTVASSNTMSTAKSWVESTDYAETTRPAYVETRSSQTLTNAAAKATFTINKDGADFGGAFICSTKARGTTNGILMCGAAFSGGDKTGDSGDKLQVTYTFAAADDGA